MTKIKTLSNAGIDYSHPENETFTSDVDDTLDFLSDVEPEDEMLLREEERQALLKLATIGVLSADELLDLFFGDHITPSSDEMLFVPMEAKKALARHQQGAGSESTAWSIRIYCKHHAPFLSNRDQSTCVIYDNSTKTLVYQKKAGVIHDALTAFASDDKDGFTIEQSKIAIHILRRAQAKLQEAVDAFDPIAYAADPKNLRCAVKGYNLTI